MQTSPAVEITLALPCYNEAENITAVLAESTTHLNQLGKSWEILVVDNCSSDNTAAVVRQAIERDSRVRLIVHDRNRLYSGSCKTILENSRGRYVALMDSDGQFSAADLPALLAEIDAGASLVFGWRKQRFDPWSRKAMSLVFNALGKFYLAYPLHDLNVGLRMFDRRFMHAAEVRYAMNMVNPELYARARQANLKVSEITVRHAERCKGATCHNFAKLGKLLCDVVRYFRNLSAEIKAAQKLPHAVESRLETKVAA
jgi:glycosyltransferase involved in cell wall biosynthesis